MKKLSERERMKINRQYERGGKLRGSDTKKKKNVVESNIDKYLYNKHIADFTSIQMHKL